MKIYCHLLLFSIFIVLYSSVARVSSQVVTAANKRQDAAFGIRFEQVRSKTKDPSILDLIGVLMGLLMKLMPSPSVSSSSQLGPEGPSMVAPPGTSRGFNELVDKAVKQAEKSVEAQLTESHGREEFNKAILAIAEERLKKFWYIGQCRRNYHLPCPISWTEVEAGTGVCAPPADYQGPCRESNFKNSNAAQKEDFAWRCEAEWPCLNAPLRNFGSACPVRWINPGGTLCIAPPEYNGYCSPATDFADYTHEMKAVWASKCDAEWPVVVAAPVTPEVKAFAPSYKGALSAVEKKARLEGLNGPVTDAGEIIKIVA